MKASLPTEYAMHDLSRSEVELVALFRNLAEHRRNALLEEAQRRRDEQVADRPAGTSPLPLTSVKGPFYCLADLTIAEVSLVNCYRSERAPCEIWAELARLQCEEIVEGSATS